MICPAEGASHETYDPWLPRVAEHTPYTGLLRLANEIPIAADTDSKQLTPETKQAILDWCTSYGLLGLVPHRTESIALAARWQPKHPFIDVTAKVGGEVLRDVLLPSRLRYFHSNNGWGEWSSTQRIGLNLRGSVLTDEPDMQGALVERDDLPDARWAQAEVIWRPLNGPGLEVVSASDSWARFFPSIPESDRETYTYPLPNTAEFARLYCEPLTDFRLAAATFRDAVRDIKLWIDHTGSAETILPSDRERIERGRRSLHSLLSPIRVGDAFTTDGMVEQSWVAPSLLSSLALMMHQAFQGGTQIRRCKKCRKIFASKAYQKRYCSDKCSWAAEKRRQRARKKDAEKRDTDGEAAGTE